MRSHHRSSAAWTLALAAVAALAGALPAAAQEIVKIGEIEAADGVPQHLRLDVLPGHAHGGR